MHAPATAARMHHGMRSTLSGVYLAMARYCPHLRSAAPFATSAACEATAAEAEHAALEEVHSAVHELSNAKMEDFLTKCPFASVMREQGMLADDDTFTPHPREDSSTRKRVDGTGSAGTRSVCPEHTRQEAFVDARSGGATVSEGAGQRAQVRSPFSQRFSGVVEEMKKEAKYRVFAKVRRDAGCFPAADAFAEDGSARRITMWCSNDYLAMGQHPTVIEAMQRAAGEYGAGSGGTRNISGNTDVHVRLERELAALHGHEAALLFGSCYAANSSTIPTLARTLSEGGPRCVIFSDAKNHASLIEGIRGAGVEKRIFRHNDTRHLRQLLEEYDADVPKLIVFESVYSMDGSIAPIADICDLADAHNGVTFLDEVHAVGLYGEGGGGVAQREGVSARVDVISGTLGKAIGVYGGYVTGRAEWMDVVRCRAPAFIFSTSLPPVVAAGALESVRILRKSPQLRELHQSRAAELKRRLAAAGIPVHANPSHIVPVMVGDAALCKRMGDELLTCHGIYVQPINYPTVAVGTERFRLTPGPHHTPAMMDSLVSSLVHVWDAHALPRAAYDPHAHARAFSPLGSCKAEGAEAAEAEEAHSTAGSDLSSGSAKGGGVSLSDIPAALAFPSTLRPPSWMLGEVSTV